MTELLARLGAAIGISLVLTLLLLVLYQDDATPPFQADTTTISQVSATITTPGTP